MMSFVWTHACTCGNILTHGSRHVRLPSKFVNGVKNRLIAVRAASSERQNSLFAPSSISTHRNRPGLLRRLPSPLPQALLLCGAKSWMPQVRVSAYEFLLCKVISRGLLSMAATAATSRFGGRTPASTSNRSAVTEGSRKRLGTQDCGGWSPRQSPCF